MLAMVDVNLSLKDFKRGNFIWLASRVQQLTVINLLVEIVEH
jgi:hypothetical protein